MVRIYRDVKRIIIHPTNVTLLTPEDFRVIPRDDWGVYIEGVKQTQTKPHQALEKTTLFMEDNIICRVNQEDKEVHCGKDPQKMKIMQEGEIR